MAYVRIENNIVVQKQPTALDGFIEAPDDVVCGMIKKGKKYILPEIPPKPYYELRRQNYPLIGDQLDAIMKWLSTEGEFNIPAELKSIAMRCMSVKAKYPKPEEKK